MLQWARSPDFVLLPLSLRRRAAQREGADLCETREPGTLPPTFFAASCAARAAPLASRAHRRPGRRPPPTEGAGLRRGGRVLRDRHHRVRREHTLRRLRPWRIDLNDASAAAAGTRCRARCDGHVPDAQERSPGRDLYTYRRLLGIAAASRHRAGVVRGCVGRPRRVRRGDRLHRPGCACRSDGAQHVDQRAGRRAPSPRDAAAVLRDISLRCAFHGCAGHDRAVCTGCGRADPGRVRGARPALVPP